MHHGRLSILFLLFFLAVASHGSDAGEKGERPSARAPSFQDEIRPLLLAKCTRCHDGPEYTSERNYELKIEPDGSPYKEWNPPTLRGVSDRGPYMHDGRARTLDELLTGPHAPEKLGAPALTPEERGDLIEFLKSL